MNRLLILITFVSVLMLQLHGVSHLDSQKNKTAHHCTLCETANSHKLISTTYPSLKLAALPQIFAFFMTERSLFITPYNLLRLRPRAPPLA